MSNPYKSPSQSNQNRNVQSQVQGPAISLIVVASLAIFFGCLGLVMDLVLFLMGFIETLERQNDGPFSEYTMLTIRTIWGIALLVASSFVLYGAIQMKKLKKFGIARAATIVAMVPLLGPCCLLGIPFGIWAFVTLGDSEVRNSFR